MVGYWVWMFKTSYNTLKTISVKFLDVWVTGDEFFHMSKSNKAHMFRKLKRKATSDLDTELGHSVEII